MHPFLEDLAKTAEEKPAKVRIFVLQFGGKMPAEEDGEIPKKKGRGKAPGKMAMVEITDQVPEEVKKFEGFFKDRAVLFLAGLEGKGEEKS
jgi:hypothetical protein